MNDLIPADPSQADPSVVALMAGVKANEGGTDYNALGDKNNEGQYTAAGIGQWSNQTNGIPQGLQQGQIPTNFANDAKQYGLDPTNFSPENQNKVMYAVLKDGKNNGLTPEQELSKWNSGDENKYLTDTQNETGSVGTYNVADYVKKGMATAQAYAQKNTQPGSNYNPKPFSNPGETDFSGQAPAPQTPQNNPITLGGIGQGALNLLNAAEKPFIGLAAVPFQALAKGLGQPDPYQKGIGGGQAPAQVDSLAPTLGGVAEQQLGNAAQVGSYFVPGGEGLLPTIAGGATMGALQGAGSAASQGKNLTDVATQGAEGAAAGGGTAGVLSGAGSLLNRAAESLTGEGAQKALQGLKDAYGSALNLNASSRAFENRTGKDLAQVLVANRAPLGRYEDGTLDASKAIPLLQQKLAPLDREAQTVLGGSKGTVNLFDAANGAKKALADKNIPALDRTQIASKIDKYIQAEVETRADSISQDTYGMNLDSLTPQQKLKVSYDAANPSGAEADKIKTAFWNSIGKGFDRDTELGNNATYQLGHSIKSGIESAFPNDRIAEINSERGDLIDAIRRLTKMDGVQKVKGGSMGKMTGNIIGTIVGASSGAGPLGAVTGDYLGGKAADFLNNPATKIGIAGAKADAAEKASGLLGRASKPTGNALSKIGTTLKRSARPAGLLANLSLNSQNKGQ